MYVNENENGQKLWISVMIEAVSLERLKRKLFSYLK